MVTYSPKMNLIEHMKCCFTILFIFLSSCIVLGQAPIINNVTPVSTYPGNRLVITGSGFSSTPSQLRVWFDHVYGNIVASTNYSITVDVPNQARLANVQVINLSNGLSVKSPLKFVPIYGGANFDPTKLSVGPSFSG